MTFKIDRNTFTATGEVTKFGVMGTITVVFQGKEFTAVARKSDFRDTVYLEGFTGRYQSGTKAWPATVAFGNGSSEKPSVDFGRDDRCGKFRKENLISYNPQ